MLEMWDVSASVLSHVWEDAKYGLLSNMPKDLNEDLYSKILIEEKSKSKFVLFILLENIYFSEKDALKTNIIIIDKGKLLLLSVVSSETLTFINIRINKNSIETAPTYTSK